MNSLLPFGPGAWLFISCYIGTLLLFGWFGYRARRENTLRDFYIAGSGFGFLVLVLTLYATQYSGNSLFGFSGKTYRVGFSWVLSVHFMIAIIVFYLVYAFRLHHLSQRRGYVTPVDFISDRFQSKFLSVVVACVMIVALSNFLLAQLMAMGRAVQGLASSEFQHTFEYGVIILAFVMVVYGTLGGIRAVAWSDVMQGAVLMVGFLLLCVIMMFEFGPLSKATESILSSPEPFTREKVMVPNSGVIREWFSYVLIVGMGGALYPQAIQRIYAAKSSKVLRHSLAVMSVLPFFTVLIAIIAGIYAIAYLPGLEGAASDQVLSRLLRVIQEGSLFGYWLVVILFAAILSAIMSTADSALLSISSMLSKDVYAKVVNESATESQLTRFGKFCSWVLIILLVALAIMLQEKASLVRLLDRKFDILVQLVPAFMLGIRWPGMKTFPTLLGLFFGLAISLVLAFGPFDFVHQGKVWGFHPGLYGLLVNLLIVISGSFMSRSRAGPVRESHLYSLTNQ